jgi:beta-glucanase (GH16 family)
MPGDRSRGGPAMTSTRPDPARRLWLAGGAALLASPPAPARGLLPVSTGIHRRPDAYRPTFRDDFDDLDVSRFNEDAVGGVLRAPAWRSRYRHPRKDFINGEKQVYVDPSVAGTGSVPLGLQPFSLRDGVLSITADRASAAASAVLWGQRYTSGAITTEYTHWQQYGWFEIRTRLPVGRGLWPAFWLLPKREAWPPEIDVFEASGMRPDEAIFTVHEPGPGRDAASSGWLKLPPPAADGFRTFACEWTERRISFYVEGRRMFEHVGHRIHEPMYLLANMGVGSSDPHWIPDPDESTPFPAAFEIDHIRAYAR